LPKGIPSRNEAEDKHGIMEGWKKRAMEEWKGGRME
jgi:hypothetical protein